MATTYSHSMADDSIKSEAEIRAIVRKAERLMGELQRIEKVLGPLGVDHESVRIGLDNVVQQYGLGG
jgi:hypothetical protein